VRSKVSSDSFSFESRASSPTPQLFGHDAGEAAGSRRANDIITLPGGDRIHVKVATQDSGGALFMTEQPIERRGSGPPRHYHEEQDEWFYCLAGEYVVEIGDQRSRLGPGDSVLGPRRVPFMRLSNPHLLPNVILLHDWFERSPGECSSSDRVCSFLAIPTKQESAVMSSARGGVASASPKCLNDEGRTRKIRVDSSEQNGTT